MRYSRIFAQLVVAVLITVAVVASSGDSAVVPLCGNLNDTFSDGVDGWANRYDVFHPLGFAPANQTDSNGDHLLIQSRIPSASQGTLVTTFQNIVAPFTPKLGVYNSEQWKCNASQISAVELDVANTGPEALNLTFILQNGYTQGPRPDLDSAFFNSSSPLRLNFTQWAATPQLVNNSGAPVTLKFSLNQSNMLSTGEGPVSYPQVKANVSKVFIRQGNINLQTSPPSLAGPEAINGTLKIYGVRAVQ